MFCLQDKQDEQDEQDKQDKQDKQDTTVILLNDHRDQTLAFNVYVYVYPYNISHESLLIM
jgi:hypothetical protein